MIYDTVFIAGHGSLSNYISYTNITLYPWSIWNKSMKQKQITSCLTNKILSGTYFANTISHKLMYKQSHNWSQVGSKYPYTP